MEKLEKVVEEHEKRLSLIEGETAKRQVPSEKPLSLPEFMRGRTVRYHKDKIVRIAYFLEKYRGQASFTVQDLDEAYSTCGYTKPANMSDIMAKARADGLLVEIGREKGIKKWVLTDTGEDVVEDEIEDE